MIKHAVFVLGVFACFPIQAAKKLPAGNCSQVFENSFKAQLKNVVPEVWVADALLQNTLLDVAKSFENKSRIEIRPTAPRGEGTNMLRIHSARMTFNEPHKMAIEVFIKVPKMARLDGTGKDDGLIASDFEVANEIYWTQFLSDAGWGAKFYGTLLTEDSRVGIITQYLDGDPTGGGYRSIKSLSFQQKLRARQRLLSMKKWLLSNRLYVQDLQLRFDDEGIVYIVDPEFFTRIPGKKMTANLREMEEQIDKFVAQFF